MRQEGNIISNIDWPLILLYIALVIIGWLNVHAAVFDEEMALSIFNLDTNAGKQFLWMIISAFVILVILIIDFRFYDSFAYIIYGVVIFALLFVLVAGKEVSGSRSWLGIGGFGIQPSEFSKFATALALAKFMTIPNFKLDRLRNIIVIGAIVAVPALLIIVQGDTGTALVFGAFVIVLYREGLTPFIIIVGLLSIAIFVLTLLVTKFWLIISIAVGAIFIIAIGKKTLKRIMAVIVGALFVSSIIFGVDYFINDVLKPHQQNRIKALINPAGDPLGYGWNVTQSKIAIGSGGLLGKGYLEGTQTKFDFVPEQSTDFIFCTLGEEHGFIGSFVLIMLFVALIFRLVMVAERQKSKFARIYGYSVASIIFIHFLVNIGMTIGLFPVIGIPLPFISYGGSSLLSFTFLLFILIKLDAHRMQILLR